MGIPAFQVMPVIPLFEDWYHHLAQGQCINLTQDRFSECSTSRWPCPLAMSNPCCCCP